MSVRQPRAVTARSVLPAPEQLRRLAKQLRAISTFQATQPLDRMLSGRARTTIAACLEELARLRADPAGARERALQEQVDEYAILATQRRLPLAAIDALLALADEAGADAVEVAAIRQAMRRTEADW